MSSTHHKDQKQSSQASDGSLKEEGFVSKHIVEPLKKMTEKAKKKVENYQKSEEQKKISDKAHEYYEHAKAELEVIRKHAKDYAKNSKKDMSSSGKDRGHNMRGYISKVKERIGKQQWDETYKSALENFMKQKDLSKEEYKKQKASFKKRWNKEILPLIRKKIEQAKERGSFKEAESYSSDDIRMSDKVNELYDQAYGEIENMRSQGKDYVDNTLKDAKDAAEKKHDKLSAYLENMRKKMGDKYDEGYEKALKEFSKQGDLTKEELEEQKDYYRNKWNEDVMPVIEEKWEKAKSALKGKDSGEADKSKDDKSISDKANELYSQAYEEIENMRSQGKDYVDNTLKDAKEAAEKKHDKLSAYLENMRKKMGDKYDEGYEKALKEFSKQGDLTKEELEEQKDYYRNKWNEDVMPVIEEKWEKAKSALKGKDSGEADKSKDDKSISDKANELYSQAYEEIENMRSQGKDYVDNTLKDAKEAAEKKHDKLSAYLENMRKKMGDKYDEGYEKALKQFSKQGDLTKEELEEQKEHYRGQWKEDVMPIIKKNWEKAKSAVGGKDSESNEDRSITDKANELYCQAYEEIESMRSQGKYYVDNTFKDAKEAAEKKHDKLSAYLANMRRKMGDKYDERYDQAIKEFSKQGDLTKEELEKQKEHYRDRWNEDVVPIIRKKLEQAKSAMKSNDSKEKDNNVDDKSISDKASEIYSQAYEEIENMRSQGKDYVSKTFKGAKESAEKKQDESSAYLENMRKRMGDKYDKEYEKALKEFSKQRELTKEEFNKQKEHFRERWNKDVMPVIKKNWEKAKSVVGAGEPKDAHHEEGRKEGS
eukprot:CAMPEP_0184504972 /NCGR_PEP_ID=MMETSP0113_2-20130426/52740_1 /TAXON_ID=91329 /ORGANISM="Norrisiella sphaerica, Strain BC52" /LENGTH=821 /DNA_ID=CAMNT_0026894635 /DNA_START=158 /DNA_END=2623 /DNA_ORIENTATION=-